MEASKGSRPALSGQGGESSQSQFHVLCPHIH